MRSIRDSAIFVYIYMSVRTCIAQDRAHLTQVLTSAIVHWNTGKLFVLKSVDDGNRSSTLCIWCFVCTQSRIYNIMRQCAGLCADLTALVGYICSGKYITYVYCTYFIHTVKTV